MPKQLTRCQNCNSKHIIYIEYAPDHPEYHDGWSEIFCQDCKKSYGRWSGKEIKYGESEPRFGLSSEQEDKGASKKKGGENI